MKNVKQILFLILTLSSVPTLGLDEISGSAIKDSTPAFELDLPIVDAPFNFSNGYSYPSMEQSLALSKDFYSTVHLGLKYKFSDSPRWVKGLTLVGTDLLSFYLPFGVAWMHEEWHRAVLSHRNINSYNGIYDFKLFSNLIAVSQINDSDLIQLKQNHPADLVRLEEAGIESQYEMNLSIEKDMFFFHTLESNKMVLWYNLGNNIYYLSACIGSGADNLTAKQNESDGSDIKKRDFTGLDCTSWVYDLHRPDEPYMNRGTHPSGVGINRYRAYSDLNSNEQKYLRDQFQLSFINIVDPFLFGFKNFKGTNPINSEPIIWNATLRHHLTSFGYSLDANIFVRQAMWNWLLIAHDYVSESKSMPGLEIQLLRYPLPWSEGQWSLSARAMAWVQPKDQRFGAESQTGGLASLKLIHKMKSINLYGLLESKTPGWVAGNVYLESNSRLLTGIEIPISL